jgi:hypothetical protein
LGRHPGRGGSPVDRGIELTFDSVKLLAGKVLETTLAG